jgi:hypothetical protein
MSEQIVPPVSTASLVNITNVSADLSLLQKFVAADKTVVIAAIVHVAVLLVAYFGLHLDAKQVAVIGSIVSGGIGLLLQMHFTAK